MFRLVARQALSLHSVPRRTMSLDRWQIEKYHNDGFLVLENAIPKEQTEALRRESDRLLAGYDLKQHSLTVFTTVNQKTDDYFLHSGDKIRFFFEENAFDEKCNLVVPIDRAVNKIGHGLHALNPVFKSFSHQKLYQTAVRDLGYVSPVIAQSMYIYKQPGIGGLVSPHQDSTFLTTKPQLSVMGLWAPLQDATQANGCIYALPSSHKKGIHGNRRMIRCINPNNPWSISTTFTAEPQSYNQEEFIAVPVKEGSVLLLHGENVHMSHDNKSDQSRHAYIIHVVESHNTQYDYLNWLQPTPALPFPIL